MKLSDATKIFAGSNEVTAVYVGSTLVWSSTVSGNEYAYLSDNLDFETQYALCGANPLWQYTSLKGGL
jgi:hypothetical protein